MLSVTKSMEVPQRYQDRWTEAPVGDETGDSKNRSPGRWRWRESKPGGHHPRRAVEHRPEIVGPAQLRLAGRQPHPHRQLKLPLSGHRRITHLGEANAAHTPSPVCLNNQPPCASIAARNTSSCATSANRIPSASASHRRVEPSTSVNRNVTTPEGAAAGADPRRISQPTRSYLALRRNPAQTPAPRGTAQRATRGHDAPVITHMWAGQR